ncbi:MAG: alpha/beta hydrolase [Okeania sp. SIO2H7]|nr:alpha/beta hydrolase [Okeania sp. SIO2H7]
MQNSPNLETQDFLNKVASSKKPPLSSQTPEQARGLNKVFIDLSHPKETVAKVENRTIPGPGGELPVRIYTPWGEGPFPVLVYFHGGGYAIGNLEMTDSICRTLTNGAECVVVSVEYRLAPEHKFPAAIEDGYSATLWVAENATAINGDASRIAVGGESAGGNLAAVVALIARDRAKPSLIYQLLIYPVTHHGSLSTESRRLYRENYFLTADSIAWFAKQYLPAGEDGTNAYASPLLAEDLTNLPPALIITAELDPLRDEGEAYGDRLRDAGVPAKISRYPGTIHVFINVAGLLTLGQQALKEAASELKRVMW